MKTWLDLPADDLFGVDNLPYGVFRAPGQEPRVGVRIGDRVLDASRAAEGTPFAQAWAYPSLNAFLAADPETADVRTTAAVITYGRVLSEGKVRPEAARPGEIVDLGGRVLGEHRGLIHFTVGQRRGIGHRGVGSGAGRPGSLPR